MSMAHLLRTYPYMCTSQSTKPKSAWLSPQSGNLLRRRPWFRNYPAAKPTVQLCFWTVADLRSMGLRSSLCSVEVDRVEAWEALIWMRLRDGTQPGMINRCSLTMLDSLEKFRTSERHSSSKVKTISRSPTRPSITMEKISRTPWSITMCLPISSMEKRMEEWETVSTWQVLSSKTKGMD